LQAHFEGGAILGFTTVSASHIEIEDLPRAKRRRLGFEPMDVLEGDLGDRPVPIAMFLSLGSTPEN